MCAQAQLLLYCVFYSEAAIAIVPLILFSSENYQVYKAIAALGMKELGEQLRVPHHSPGLSYKVRQG